MPRRRRSGAPTLPLARPGPLVAVALLVVALLALAVAGVPRPAPVRAADSGPPAPVERVLILSLPHVTWTALEGGGAPALQAAMQGGALANLSVRATQRRTTVGEGYATLGAGTAAGAPDAEEGLALAADERFESGTAADAFQRRLGAPLAGPVGLLSLPAYRALNESLLLGGRVGSLGEALRAAGVGAAVVANADRSLTTGEPAGYARQAAVALVDAEGVVPAGRVDRGLLRPDPGAAFGVALDRRAVEAAFDAVWRDRSAVLVEASDLVRAEAYRERVPLEQGQRLFERALRSTDELVASLLTRVDPTRHAVLVVGPASPVRRSRLTVAALVAPGVRPGLLRSASTRRSGFVTLPDVAPTVLDLLGLPRAPAMAGRPFTLGTPGGDHAGRVAELAGMDRAARFRDDMLLPVGWTLVISEALLSGAAILVLRRPGRGRRTLGTAALVPLALLPCTYLAALLPFAEWGTAVYLTSLFGAAVLAGVLLGSRPSTGSGRRRLLPLELVLTTIVGVLVGSLLLGSRLQLSTIFGDSPIVGGRFTGMNNVSHAQLVAAALLLVAFLVHRHGRVAGGILALALLTVVVVVDGAPMWGSDIGGVLATAPAVAAVAFTLYGRRLGLRTALAGAGGTAAALGAFALIDLRRPASGRSHLGRLLEQMDAEGWGALSQVVERKLMANLSVLTRSTWSVMVMAAMGFIAWLVFRSPSVLAAIQRRLPEMRLTLTGMAVVGVLGFALNDSGIAVPGMMLAVLIPSLVYLAARFA